MRTDFGKELRKLRAENDERMLDMARRLEKSASFLSAVEIGKKEPPVNFEEAVITIYKIVGEAADKLRFLADRSRKAFTLQPEDAFARDTAALMARKIDGLSKAQIKNIHAILNEGEGK